MDKPEVLTKELDAIYDKWLHTEGALASDLMPGVSR
jgi:hypothetical protein